MLSTYYTKLKRKGQKIYWNRGEDGGSQRGEHVGSPLGENPGEHAGSPLGENPGEHVGSPLGRVIQWFKTMTTNEYIRGVKTNGWQRFDGKLWQRNYWERKIFGDRSYQSTVKYIVSNPANWKS